jgi:hypothetical protein
MCLNFVKWGILLLENVNYDSRTSTQMTVEMIWSPFCMTKDTIQGFLDVTQQNLMNIHVSNLLLHEPEITEKSFKVLSN